jgi:6,7-dimethyl-8-ribityllumazine synthase
VRHHDPAAPLPALPSAAGYRFALIVSSFNETITNSLAVWARKALLEAGADAGDIEEFRVPGAFELPQAARSVAVTGRFDAAVCLGCVIRGGTPHFEYISSATAQGTMNVATMTGMPIGFGVLTTDTVEQAQERAGDGRDNKGWEAAVAALETAVLFRKLGRPAAKKGSGRAFGFEPARGSEA